jgi:hypothetical protein
LTDIASATDIAGPLPFGATTTRGGELAVAVVCTAEVFVTGWVEDAVLLSPETESFPVVPWLEGVGFAGGNNSCEIAMTISERKRATKKRLSIQGTGS